MSNKRLRGPLAALLAAAFLVGCAAPAGTDPDSDEGFVMTDESFIESSGEGSSRYVGAFRNVADDAEQATFTVTLLDRDGRAVWTGRGTAEDVAADETVRIALQGDTDPPLEHDGEIVFSAVRG